MAFYKDFLLFREARMADFIDHRNRVSFSWKIDNNFFPSILPIITKCFPLEVVWLTGKTKNQYTDLIASFYTRNIAWPSCTQKHQKYTINDLLEQVDSVIDVVIQNDYDHNKVFCKTIGPWYTVRDTVVALDNMGRFIGKSGKHFKFMEKTFQIRMYLYFYTHGYEIRYASTATATNRDVIHKQLYQYVETFLLEY